MSNSSKIFSQFHSRKCCRTPSERTCLFSFTFHRFISVCVPTTRRCDSSSYRWPAPSSVFALNSDYRMASYHWFILCYSSFVGFAKHLHQEQSQYLESYLLPADPVVAFPIAPHVTCSSWIVICFVTLRRCYEGQRTCPQLVKRVLIVCAAPCLTFCSATSDFVHNFALIH